MVGIACADPGDTCGLGFFHGQFGGVAHHQMSQPVVAINQGGCRALAENAKLRRDVHAAGFDAFDVLGQAKDTMPVLANKIGPGHQFGGFLRVGAGHAAGNETACDKGMQNVVGHGIRSRGHCVFLS